MKLIVVRHGPSMDRSAFDGDNDRLRPLTERGKEVTREVALGFRALGHAAPDPVSSPLTRARQTAEIFRDVVVPEADIEETESLVPTASPAEFLRFARDRDLADPTALFGHRPHVDRFLAHLLPGGDEPFTRLEKGSVTALFFPGVPVEGGGRLLWSHPPDHLRLLADGNTGGTDS